MDKPKESKFNAPKRVIQPDAGMGQEPLNQRSMKQPTDFLALNDKVLLEIFKYLPLNDVCSLSQTCRRMHALGASHFMLNYKSKVIVFVDWWYGNLTTFPNQIQEKYIECFAKNMRSVTLLKHFSTINAMKKLSQFYQCGAGATPPIKAIRFVNWKLDVSIALITPIAAILKNIESLTFEDTSINADLNGYLFGFLPNLKRLTVLGFPNNDPRFGSISSNSIWMQPPCPTLEYFAWHKGSTINRRDEFPAIEIVRFLKINPGIKFVSLRLNSKEQLKMLMATGIQVNELFFTIACKSFDQNEAEIDEIMNELKVFCEKQKSMKVINDVQRIRLHLKIDGYDFKEKSGQLELLAPYIVGIYFESFILECFAPVFPKLINLKVLQVSEYVRAELLRLLPNLEEIFVGCLALPLSSYDKDMLTLGSRLPKLKKLYFNGYMHRSLRNYLAYGGCMDDFSEENFGVFEKIDNERKKLPGAQKLKIYLEVEQDLRKEKVNYDMTEIVRTQTEAITNPFFKQSFLVDVVAAPDALDRCLIQ